jgi:hypothetical protein
MNLTSFAMLRRRHNVVTVTEINNGLRRQLTCGEIKKDLERKLDLWARCMKPQGAYFERDGIAFDVRTSYR